MTVVRGIDTDNYDGPVSVARFRHLYDAYGVRFNIPSCEVGADGGDFTQVQIDNSLAAGLVVPCSYKFPYWVASDLERMKRAAGFGYPVRVDCEYKVPANWSVAQVVERIHQCRDVLRTEGRYGGIYTGAWWWPQNTNNCLDFIEDPLWHAAYPFNKPGGPAVLPPADFMPAIPQPVSYWGGRYADIMQYADICYDEPTFDMNAMDLASSQEEIMQRFNSIAPSLQGFEGTSLQIKLTDFQDQVPPAATVLRIEGYLDSGVVQVFDGKGAYAGQIGWDGARYGICDVDVTGGAFTIRGAGGSSFKLAQLGLVGYW